MPAFETMDRHQKVLYWEFDRTNAVNEPVFAEPVQLTVRWVLKDSESRDAQGNTVASSVSVVADRYIVIGSLMWLAPEQGRRSKTALEQWYGESGSATDDEFLYEVVASPVTPSIKGEFTRYACSLAFYKRELHDQ